MTIAALWLPFSSTKNKTRRPVGTGWMDVSSTTLGETNRRREVANENEIGAVNSKHSVKWWESGRLRRSSWPENGGRQFIHTCVHCTVSGWGRRGRSIHCTAIMLFVTSISPHFLRSFSFPLYVCESKSEPLFNPEQKKVSLEEPLY